MTMNKDTVLARLGAVAGLDGKPLAGSPALSEVVIRDGKVYFSIAIDPARAAAAEPVRAAAQKAVEAIAGAGNVLASLTAEQAPSPDVPPPRPAAARPAPGPQPSKPLVPGVKHIVAVASGKGGVGKSTTSCNLALALAGLGLKVGVLDADIYGPSMPKLFRLSGKPDVKDGRILIPMVNYGIKVMSIGFLVEEDQAMIWRGPMVMSALTQMLREVEWGDLDVLIVDMPPGTGDAQLTMAQNVPLAGAVIVSTPQDLALIDARRGVAMFEKVGVPIIGLIENMSYFIAPDTGKRYDIFGHGGARYEAARLKVPFLGEVPLDMDIRIRADSGTPIVATDPGSIHAGIYRGIAEQVWSIVSTGAIGKPAPRIVYE
ncbi:MAG: Mrp/NBP35 family ATP-binding protein [Hyphomicrobiaceae bacterium]|nr:Mrp/NBP35 family ATP-binding protein [Hyphomicrobiaceae bacterium]